MLISRARLSQFGADMGIALTGSANLAEMICSCAEICRLYSDSLCVGIWLYDSDSATLHLQSAEGTFEGKAFPAERLHLGAASAGHIARELQPFASRNPADIPWFNNRDFMLSNDVRFFAGYPVSFGPRLIGVIELYSRHLFCWDLLNMLDTLSDQMAVGFERMIIEDRMRVSLEEKEVLLREIHHRIKNNMQVISSLLNLQSDTIDDPRHREMFSESKNRIRAMALIHEKLYQTRDIANIDFGDYIASLANGLFMFYGTNPSQVELSIEAEGVVIGIDTAIPCGLIINELLSNALKYAFPDGKAGMIRIAIKKNDTAGGGTEYALTVADNGIGLPKDFDFRNARTLGLHLVMSLAEHQLQGSMKVIRDSGTAYQISFRDAKYRKRV
jgi:two-component sensor histidine kinase